MTALLTVILLLCLAGLVACLFRLRANPAGARTWLVGLVVVALLAGVLRTCAARSRLRAQVALGCHSALGFRLGQALALAVPGGGDVLVLQYNFAGKPSSTSQAQLAGLKKSLDEHRLKVSAVEPAFVPGKDAYPEELGRVPRDKGAPESLFFGSLAKHPGVAGVVSFIGFPLQPDSADPAKPREGLPPIVLFSPGPDPVWARWLSQGRLAAVAIPKPGAAAPAPGSDETGDWAECFDRYFLLVTRENLEQVLAQMR